MTKHFRQREVFFYGQSITDRIDQAMDVYHKLQVEKMRRSQQKSDVGESSCFTGLFNLTTPCDAVFEIKELFEYFETCWKKHSDPISLITEVNTLVYITKSFEHNGVLHPSHVGLTYSLIDFVLEAMYDDESFYRCRQQYAQQLPNNGTITQFVMQMYLLGNTTVNGTVVTLPKPLAEVLIASVTQLAFKGLLTHTDAKAIIDYFNGIIEE